jgi:hypothetical protein
MSVKLNKFIDLVKRTGQPCVLADTDSGEAFVLMSLDQYEDMQCDCSCGEDGCGEEGLTEDELDELMDRDFAALQSHEAAYAGDVRLSEGAENAETGEQKDDEDRFYLEPVE